MNRIVLIGNGFDLAHDLHTSYKDFVNWYWERRIKGFATNVSKIDEDCLCILNIVNREFRFFWSQFAADNKDVPPQKILEYITHDSNVFKLTKTPFFENICKSIDTKGWVDIENEYYALLKEYVANPNSCKYSAEELHKQLHYLQDLLIEYLTTIPIKETIVKKEIKNKIYSPFVPRDFSVEGKDAIREHYMMWSNADVSQWIGKLQQYGINGPGSIYTEAEYLHKTSQRLSFEDVKSKTETQSIRHLLPDNIMLVSFNYTDTARFYFKKEDGFFLTYIHGELSNKDCIIFGYGDELDESYKDIQNKNNNEYLKNIKSIRYQESDRYRKLQDFIESAPFQVIIMGHSCGNSDRTLLNTLFEHKNCVSIKPYYYKKDDGTDNYLEIVQNISRNFTDMKKMRDRVVNKTYCETLIKDSHK